ncbi:SRPBCC domain-containing protein [Mycobacterium sp. CPCC 205372]|uniref:SRPBCC domain-containing protein n=1 Tax=Mycobacterium hippophais TaxID=3016340 RepID=A0ABT4PU07_9MYCO|nr:SRPBCC domain-containing protein [Mycobacterium hippophais]MCZ8379974.1 SRPBCC domain-containing protein [Mycobacterium hippophais]
MTTDPELDPTAVEIGRFYPHEPDLVWRALTDPKVVEQWLMPSTGMAAAAEGTHFVFMVPTQPPGEIACEVLQLRPGEQLVLSWVDLRATRPARWVVDWAVHREGRGTRLLLTHSGFDINDRRQKMARNGMERMWRRALTQLGELLDRTQ